MELADVETIEEKVVSKRHLHYHLGRVRTDEKVFYILHSQACKDTGIDLRQCVFSLAFDKTSPYSWNGPLNATVRLGIEEESGALYSQGLHY